MKHRIVAGATGLLLLMSGTPAFPEPRASSFPHARHARLFTACTACHDMAPTDAPERLVKVTAADCARCHDGNSAPVVGWSPSRTEAPNLQFSHERHVGREGADCLTCHAAPRQDPVTGGPAAGHGSPPAARMPDIVRPTAETCLACHQAAGHLSADAVCSRCHDPLSNASALTVERIGAFPHPPNHEAADFLWAHGELAERDLARCAVCHAK
ncbi:MAG TPA: cytochrome c3 family protein, partial [Candidatus Eisenbacteria bacterium]